MKELRKFVAPEFVFRIDAINLVSRYARNFGIVKILMVTDEGVIKAGWAGKVIELIKEAGILYEVYSNVSPNPRDYECMEGAEFYRQNKCNALLLPFVVEYRNNLAPERFNKIAGCLNLPLNKGDYKTAKARLLEHIKEFNKKVGINKNLSGIGLKKADIPRLAQNAIKDPCVVTNPRKPCIRDIKVIYEEAS